MERGMEKLVGQRRSKGKMKEEIKSSKISVSTRGRVEVELVIHLPVSLTRGGRDRKSVV